MSDSVLLEYQINSDGIWLLSDQNQLTEWTPYYFPLPYPPGTTIEMRLTDKLNPEYSGYVGKFIISEYQWENVSEDLPFTPRDGSGLLNFKDKMWLIGGWDPHIMRKIITPAAKYIVLPTEQTGPSKQKRHGLVVMLVVG